MLIHKEVSQCLLFVFMKVEDILSRHLIYYEEDEDCCDEETKKYSESRS